MLFVKQDLEENWYTYENAKSCLMVVYTENNEVVLPFLLCVRKIIIHLVENLLVIISTYVMIQERSVNDDQTWQENVFHALINLSRPVKVSLNLGHL